MGTLRNIGTAAIVAITVLGTFGIVAAMNSSWVVVTALFFGGLVTCLLTLLLIARNVSYNARTSERRIKVVVQKSSARVKQAMKRHDEALAQQELYYAGLNQTLSDITRFMTEADRTSRERFAQLHTSVLELEKTAGRLAKTNRQQLTHTIRDSTRQTESLVPIFQRYPEVKLPMPSTGGFAIDSQALAHLLTLVEERQPQRILELGSGTSTIWLGYLCRTFGTKLISLDHLEYYLNLTRGAVVRHGLSDAVDTRLAPLETTECNGRSFEWYSSEAMADLGEIDMLIVDGPPAATGPQARYPSLPKLIDHLAPHATVILDDAQRDDEDKIVVSWLKDFPEFRRIEKGTSRLAVLERDVK